jgi:protein TonB
MALAINNYARIAEQGFNHDRLGFAFCLALALHAAFILGVSFNREEPSAASSKLEITLAQHRSEKTPEEADFLAQNSQEGSGTLEEKAMLTATEIADYQDTQIREITQPQRSQSEEKIAVNPELTTSADSTFTSIQQRSQDQSAEHNQQRQDDMSMEQRSKEIASLEAKLDIQEYAYARRPRIRRLTSVATKQADDALYLHNWRTKVEAIGNQHYPSKAKQMQLFGDLRMVVSLLPNGDVYQVKILKSSGHKILDQAALKIVHLAAPYDVFPAQMQKDVDVLEIIRTWRFHKNKLSAST